MNERLEDIKEWQDIIGYEGLYKINKYGEIKSLERKVKSSNGYRKKKSMILKQTDNHRGYKTVCLCKKGRCKQFFVHRLVAINFIREPLEKEVVNHIDGDKLNNHYMNLEWCYQKDNNQHAIDNKLWTAYGVNHYLSKFSEEDVGEIKNKYKCGYTYREISKIYNVHEATIGKLIREETYSKTMEESQ